jgi:hypothetical protein
VEAHASAASWTEREVTSWQASNVRLARCWQLETSRCTSLSGPETSMRSRISDNSRWTCGRRHEQAGAEREIPQRGAGE